MGRARVVPGRERVESCQLPSCRAAMVVAELLYPVMGLVCHNSCRRAMVNDSRVKRASGDLGLDVGRGAPSCPRAGRRLITIAVDSQNVRKKPLTRTNRWTPKHMVRGSREVEPRSRRSKAIGQSWRARGLGARPAAALRSLPRFTTGLSTLLPTLHRSRVGRLSALVATCQRFIGENSQDAEKQWMEVASRNYRSLHLELSITLLTAQNHPA